MPRAHLQLPLKKNDKLGDSGAINRILNCHGAEEDRDTATDSEDKRRTSATLGTATPCELDRDLREKI